MLLPLTSSEIAQLQAVRFFFTDDQTELIVQFPSGAWERWALAPADYPTDGRLEVLQINGRVYVPIERES